MGLPGRPRTPTAMKVIRGTNRPDRANPAEPQPPTLEVGVQPPAWLRGQRRRRAWADLVVLLNAEAVLTVMDAAALAMLVDAYGDYLEASDLVAGAACGRCGLPVKSSVPCPAFELDDPAEGEEATDEGPVGSTHSAGRRYYTTRTKEGSLMIRPHPAMAVRQDAWKRVTAMLSRFGMDPSSRSKVSKAAGGADEMDDLLSDAG